MATPQHHYWSPLRAEASPPPLGLLAGRRAAASRSFAAASPSATIVVRLHGRAHSADVTDAAAPRPLAGDYGDLGSSNLALALPTRLPAVSPASALAQEAERLAQDQQGRPRPLLLGELAVAVAQRQAEVTDALWAALLNLHKADKGATPSALERFFRVAEEIAPLGCMGHTQVALSLTSVYGAKIGRRWAALTSTGIGSGVLAGASLGPRNPRDSGVSGEGDMSDELKLLSGPHPKEEELKVVLENHYLINHPRVIITPHIAFDTGEAVRRILDTTLENIAGFEVGEPKNILAL